MIQVTKLLIQDVGSLKLEVLTSVGKVITEVLIWKAEDFDAADKSVDVSDLIVGTGNTEDITVTATKAGFDLKGLFFVRITSDDVSENTVTYPVANFVKYHAALVDKLLTTNIIGGEYNLDLSSNNNKNYIFFGTKLLALSSAIKASMFAEAIIIDNSLRLETDIITTVFPEYNDLKLVANTGFSIIDDTLTEV